MQPQLQTQPQLLLQSEAGSNNKRDKTKSRKHHSHGGIFVSETDFFFDDKGLQLSLLN